MIRIFTRTPLMTPPNETMPHFQTYRDSADPVTGQFVKLEGQSWYKITNSHRMKPFFMTLVSASDHWMFVSSGGAVSAGRRNPDSALFPYYSSDKILDLVRCTGPRTIIQVDTPHQATTRWEPLSGESILDNTRTQNLYKHELGNRVMFEEIHHLLGLAFRYTWMLGERYGFIRVCELVNLDDAPVRVTVTDGIENIVPSGLDRDFQLRYSNLADAYKKNELLTDASLGLYYLSSVPTDLAEPSEGLRATVVWHHGWDDASIAISSDQVDGVRAGQPLEGECNVRGRRGAFLVSKTLDLSPLKPARWRTVADVDYDHADVVELHDEIVGVRDTRHAFESDIIAGDQSLIQILSSNDGIQLGGDRLRTQRHQSNVIFNVMRGGYPANGYSVDINDFCESVKRSSVTAYARNEPELTKLNDSLPIDQLQTHLANLGDPDLTRFGQEYLPLCFSRRHGDPTRPWNRFSIDLKQKDGRSKLSYEGNWRDIFQNWEALAVSYPQYAASMVYRFVNASTADGYNPYRITKDGMEWEEPDPSDPWSNIGYWGDHQIIYLLKLLQWSQAFDPGRLDRGLSASECTYADIPYRIGGFDRCCRDPQNTIDYDQQVADQIAQRVDQIGADGKLLTTAQGHPYRVSLMEKLLVPLLAKLTNFVPGGGVWLNTQRPEWNDANNALVGRGLSVVTTCYLRRYLTFLIDWLSSDRASIPASTPVSIEVAELMDAVHQVIHDCVNDPDAAANPVKRRSMVQRLSVAGQQYRDPIYADGFCGQRPMVSASQLVCFFKNTLQVIDDTIRCNLRSDGLYHSYNLMDITPHAANIQPLYEMLEGQVAVISSGLLSQQEVLSVLDSLRQSRCFREDQGSYMLYPDRSLPRFLEKNRVPSELAFRSHLLMQLIADKHHGIVRQDVGGDIRFSGDFRNEADLNAALDHLQTMPQYRDLVDQERLLVTSIYEATFNHHHFTGRSGTFFGYEGLGSIYWHMVSKLSLAVMEQCVSATSFNSKTSDGSDGDFATTEKLYQHYREIREGLGLNKTPDVYGAFPFDPYSHTPSESGVQQPGMTGQVKEDILTRWYELGIRIHDGQLRFNPSLFESSEWLSEADTFEFFDVQGDRRSESIAEDSFAFTLCQVPIVYRIADRKRLLIHYPDQDPIQRDCLSLTVDESRSIFDRSGKILMIEIWFPATRT